MTLVIRSVCNQVSRRVPEEKRNNASSNPWYPSGNRKEIKQFHVVNVDVVFGGHPGPRRISAEHCIVGRTMRKLVVFKGENKFQTVVCKASEILPLQRVLA